MCEKIYCVWDTTDYFRKDFETIINHSLCYNIVFFHKEGSSYWSVDWSCIFLVTAYLANITARIYYFCWEHHLNFASSGMTGVEKHQKRNIKLSILSQSRYWPSSWNPQNFPFVTSKKKQIPCSVTLTLKVYGIYELKTYFKLF